MINVMIVITITYLTILLKISLQGINLLMIFIFLPTQDKNSNCTIVMFAKMEGIPPQN
jgi:hypothetical protein